MKRFSWLLLAALACGAPAWSADEAVIKTRVIPAQATLGDEIKLVIALESPAGARLEAPSAKIKLAPFELKRVESRADASLTLILTVFEMGEQTVPPLPLTYTDASGRSGQAVTQAQKVKIVPVKRKPGDKDQIRDIKGPVSLSLTGWWILLGAVLALSLGALLGWSLYRRLKRRIVEDLEAKLPPHERAERELERLQRAGHLDAGRTKEYYSELSDILRRYFERRYRIEALESTTVECLARLKELTLERSLHEKVRNLLERADLVKFAKFIPARGLADELVSDLTLILEGTKPPPEPETARKGPKP